METTTTDQDEVVYISENQMELFTPAELSQG